MSCCCSEVVIHIHETTGFCRQFKPPFIDSVKNGSFNKVPSLIDIQCKIIYEEGYVFVTLVMGSMKTFSLLSEKIFLRPLAFPIVI